MLILIMPSLKQNLEKFYSEFDFSKRFRHDPIVFPKLYQEPVDSEIAGFISSCFSYGKISLFMPVIEKVLKPGGKHPAKFIRELDLKRDSRHFGGISYRFNKQKDILCLLYLTGAVLRKWGSLKDLFYSNFSLKDADTEKAIKGFVEEFLAIDTSPVYGSNIRPRGLLHFFPSPANGSACKRINLFLRWMVRRKDIDLGLWKKLLPSRLIIPLDTHITKISKCLGLTKRSDTSWRTAREITESLKMFDPKDPLKFDFALCHQGISGLCKGRQFRDICANCVLY